MRKELFEQFRKNANYNLEVRGNSSLTMRTAQSLADEFSPEIRRSVDDGILGIDVDSMVNPDLRIKIIQDQIEENRKQEFIEENRKQEFIEENRKQEFIEEIRKQDFVEEQVRTR